MENKFNKPEDQATELRKLLDEVEQGEAKQHSKQTDIMDVLTEPNRDIDILNLPPRKDVHSNKKRTKIKISLLFIRFIIVILVLFGVLFGAYYLWGDELFHLINSTFLVFINK